MSFAVTLKNGIFVGSFQAMASPCEVLVETPSLAIAREITALVCDETRRIEQKFSRYLEGNIIHKIHHSNSVPVAVDEETASLFNFAGQAYEITNGLFDITSGILRKVWKFDCGNKIPSRNQVKKMLPLIGWEKVKWDGKQISLPEGMEVDMGGFGKEYACDKAVELVKSKYDLPVLVNLGGDLRASKTPTKSKYWSIGTESSDANNLGSIFKLEVGAITTSGDTKKYVLHKGKYYCHILNPRTGWPVNHGPKQVSVGSKTCIEAGLISTLAMLKGRSAEEFLEEQNVLFHVQR